MDRCTRGARGMARRPLSPGLVPVPASFAWVAPHAARLLRRPPPRSVRFAMSAVEVRIDRPGGEVDAVGRRGRAGSWLSLRPGVANVVIAVARTTSASLELLLQAIPLAGRPPRPSEPQQLAGGV